MNSEDRSGVENAEMDVTDGDVELPPTDQHSPPTEPAGEAEAPAEGEAPQAEPELPQKFVPPDRGDPFTLRVDRTEIPLEGARVIDDHIVIPKDIWERQVQHKYVANRDEWRAKEQRFQQELTTLRQTVPEEREQARAQLAELQSMLDGTPQGREKLIAWLDGYEQNAPMLKLQAELRLKQERLDKIEAERAEVDLARQAEELRPRLQAHLADQVTAIQKEFPQLKGQKDLTEWVWRFHADKLFYEDQNGRPQFRDDYFRDLMQDQARRVAVVAEKTAKVTQVAQKNAAAVGPTKTATKPKPTASPSPKRQVTKEEWEEQFDKEPLT